MFTTKKKKEDVRRQLSLCLKLMSGLMWPWAFIFHGMDRKSGALSPSPRVGL